MQTHFLECEDVSRPMRMAQRTKYHPHRVMVGKPEGKGPLGRPRLRWEDNNKMALQEVEGGDMDWIEMA